MFQQEKNQPIRHFLEISACQVSNTRNDARDVNVSYNLTFRQLSTEAVIEEI